MAAFWYEDSQNQFGVLNDANTGFQLQKQLSMERRAILLMGRVHAGLFSQSQFMVDGVNVHG